MKLLLVEDEDAIVEEVQNVLALLPGTPSCRVAKSRDSAISYLTDDFFDLIVLDLCLPTKDGALDANAEHGHLVFSKAREIAPGTPILVVTGSPAEDFVSDLLNQAQKVDVWGTGNKIATIQFLRKLNLDRLKPTLAPIAEAVRGLSEVELDRGALELSREQETLVRIFCRAVSGAKCVVSALGGGLSEACVLRLKVTGANGALLRDAVAKIASEKDVDDESERYQRHVDGLDSSATPRKLVKLTMGAKATAAVFYALADGFIWSAFEVAHHSGDAAIVSLRRALQKWRTGVPQSQRSIGDVRRRLVSDATAEALFSEHSLDWARALEERSVQTFWCCIHGDLHGGNVLVSRASQSVVIDYGDVGEGPASLDPVTLELSTIFHPDGCARNHTWPTSDQRKNWGILEVYLAGSPIASFVTACRLWAKEVAAGNREIGACAYAYLLRQLKYQTPKEIIYDFLDGARTLIDST